MLPTSRFESGTILWLPHVRRLPYNTLYLGDTVPDDCFGHPVLFLATNPSDDAAWILIVRHTHLFLNLISRLTHPLSSPPSATLAPLTKTSAAMAILLENTSPSTQHQDTSPTSPSSS